MSEHSETLTDAGVIEWEREVRGYNRQQVDEVVARQTGTIRDLKNSLHQCVVEIERLRTELVEAREAGGRRPHEQISERVGQILKLAEDEAKVTRESGIAEVADMRAGALAETDKLRIETKAETDRLRAEAQDRAERMLAAASEQSERAVTTATAQAESLVSTAQESADQTVADANKHAEATVASAMAQAKQQLDDATARANAIHDGAERRLNLLISRHTETVRRLTEIRDVVTSLVSGEAARGSLEEEVGRMLAGQSGPNGSDGRPGGHAQSGGHAQAAGPAQQGGLAPGGLPQHDSGHGGAHRAPRVAAALDGRRAAAAAAAQAAAAQADGHQDELAAHSRRPAPPSAGERDGLGDLDNGPVDGADHDEPDQVNDDHHDGRYGSQSLGGSTRQDMVLDEASAASPNGHSLDD